MAVDSLGARHHRVMSRRTGVAAYLAIAFGLAWAPFVPVVFGGTAVGLVLMPVAPAIACVVVRKWITREGLAGLGLRPSLHEVRRHWPLFAVALLWPFLATPLAALVAGRGFAATDPAAAFGWVALSAAVAPVILGEELGWRGYLQLRVCPGHPLPAALVTGVLWGVWHYPLILSVTDAAGPLILLEFTAGTVTMSVFLGWLRARTSTVWAPSLGHSSNNVTEDNLIRSVFGTTSTSPTAAGAVLLAEATVLLGIVAVDRRSRSRRRRKTIPQPGRVL